MCSIIFLYRAVKSSIFAHDGRLIVICSVGVYYARLHETENFKDLKSSGSGNFGFTILCEGTGIINLHYEYIDGT